MTLVHAIEVAVIAATALGHVLTTWDRDTYWSAISTCNDCGLIAAVDIAEEDKNVVLGRATRHRCREGVPHGTHIAA